MRTEGGGARRLCGLMRHRWRGLAAVALFGAACSHLGTPDRFPVPAVSDEPACRATVALPAQPAERDTSWLTLRMVLNIPAFRLDVYQGAFRVRRYAVAVGARKYPTPVGSFAVSEAEWNPWWVPPPSDWARENVVTPPGPGNPMGQVKLYFRDLYFIHGTPQPESVGKAVSHGCVRLANQDAVDLATLLHAWGIKVDSGQGRAGASSASPAEHTTRRVVLARPVPLEIRYQLVELQEEELVIYPDVYGLAQGQVVSGALEVLAHAGYDAGSMDLARLERLARAAARGPVALPIAALTQP